MHIKGVASRATKEVLGLLAEMVVTTAQQRAIATGTTEDATGIRHWASWPRWWRMQRSSAPSPQAPWKMRLASGTGPLGRDGREYSAAVRHRLRHHGWRRGSVHWQRGRCSKAPSTITPSSGPQGCNRHPSTIDYYTKLRLAWMRLASCTGPFGRDGGEHSTAVRSPPPEASQMATSQMARAARTLPLGRYGSKGIAARTACTRLHGRGGEEDAEASVVTVTATCTGPRGRDGGKTVRQSSISVASRMVVGSVLARASCTLPLGRCGSEGNAARTACTGLHGQGGEATMKQAPAHVTATCTGPRGREDGKTVRGKAASRGHHGWRLEAGTLPPGRVGNKGSAAQQRTGLHGRGGGEDAAASTITRDSNLHWASWP